VEQELNKNLYTPKETAVLTKVHLNTVYRWIRTGYLPAIVKGPRRIYVTKETIGLLMAGEDYATRKND
jgi:excisionase family DNA binding protein